jgi:hypothetical protein
MKNLIYSLGLFITILAASPTLASTCKVLEADGREVSAATEIKAKKAAWSICAANKIANRESITKRLATVDEASLDAESCINAKIDCR